MSLSYIPLNDPLETFASAFTKSNTAFGNIITNGFFSGSTLFLNTFDPLNNITITGFTGSGSSGTISGLTAASISNALGYVPLSGNSVQAGTYNTLLVDSKGLIVSGTNVTYSTSGGGISGLTIIGDIVGQTSGGTLLISSLVPQGQITPGAYNNFIVNQKGLITSAFTINYSTSSGSNQLITFSGDAYGSGATAVTITLNNITSGRTVGSSTQIPVIQYDAKGRIISATTVNVAGGSVVGEIINDSIIDSYSLVGSNTSQSTVSGKRRLTTSTNVTSYTNFLNLDYITWLEKFEFSVTLTPVTDGNGIAIGFINSGTSGFFVLLDMNTSEARGTLTLVSTSNGTPTTLLASSSNLITYSNTDELIFVLKRDGYRLVASVYVNGTIAGSLDYNASLNNSSMSIGKINKLSIAQLGGTQDLSNITFSSNCKRNQQLAIVGDSNTYGFNLASSGGVYEDAYSQIVGNAMADGAVVYAANGSKLSDFQAQLDEFILLKPSFVSIHLGTNDAVASVTDTAYLATLDAIIESLLDEGIGIIINTVIPTTTGGYNTFIVSYNVGINARSTKVLVVGQYAAFQSGGLLQAEDHTDGIHLSILGQRKFASTFIAATPFLKNNNPYPFLVGTGDRAVIVNSIGKQETKDIVETSFDSTQISDAETESGWTAGLKAISNTIEGQYHRSTTTGYEYYCYSDGNCLRRVYGDATTAEENGIITLPDVITADSSFANNKSSCKISNSGSKLNISLPTTCPVGTLCRAVGLGSGGWKIVQNSGQSIKYDAATSTTGTGGSIESNSAQYASITIMCIIANTTFSVIEGSPVASLTIT